MGLVGMASLIVLILSSMKMVVGTKSSTGATVATVVLVGLASFIFSNSTVLGMYTLFLGLALLTADYARNNSAKAYKIVLSVTSVAKSFSILGTDTNQNKNKEIFHYLVILPFPAADDRRENNQTHE
jgi:hypothetical protein